MLDEDTVQANKFIEKTTRMPVQENAVNEYRCVVEEVTDEGDNSFQH